MEETKFCHKCGEKILEEAEICPKCGVRQNVSNMASSNWITTFLLCLFLGSFGAHRFYTGHTGSGIAMLLILLLLGWVVVGLVIVGIWAFIDLITIVCGNFPDANGNKIAIK